MVADREKEFLMIWEACPNKAEREHINPQAQNRESKLQMGKAITTQSLPNTHAQ